MNWKQIIQTLCLWGIVGIGIGVGHGATQATQSIQKSIFEEVYQLTRQELRLVSPQQIDQAALQGLLEHLWPYVQMLPPTANTHSEQIKSFVRVLKGRFVQIHPAAIEEGSYRTFRSLWKKQVGTNHIEGLVLDLRFTAGWDYQEAARWVGCLLGPGRRVVRVESEWIVSTSVRGPDVRRLPLVVLINSETRGAAEALAAACKANPRCLFIGGKTADEAYRFALHSLSDQRTLRIAVGKVQAFAGGVPVKALTPDLAVSVPLQVQRDYLKDPYTPRGSLAYLAHQQPAARPTEAELVQLHQVIRNPSAPAAPPSAPKNKTQNQNQKKKPTIYDPILNRALDVLQVMHLLQPIGEPGLPKGGTSSPSRTGSLQPQKTKGKK